VFFDKFSFVFFCQIPPQGQPILHSPKSGVIMSSGDLALQGVTRHQAGNYTCLASNVEGDGESNFAQLKVMCKLNKLNSFLVLTSNEPHKKDITVLNFV
jgi:hypothetical protein